MKNLFLTLLLIVLSYLTSFSQNRIIENPPFEVTTAPNVKITSLELRDTTTVLHFKVNYPPGRWISVGTSDTRIINSAGGEPLYVKKSEGIALNERHIMDESGVHQYVLYFPPLEKGTEKIDFLENQWKIFDIHLTDQPIVDSPFPPSLLGNWLKTDGSNGWTYSFDKDKLIMNRKVFTIVEVKSKKKKGEIIYQTEDQLNSLFYKEGKNGQMLIDFSPKNMETYSQQTTEVPSYHITNDDFFETPIFSKDSAVYTGYIKGYHPKLGKTGLLHLDNVLTQNQESYTININPDGTFYAKFPMIYPEQAYIRLMGRFESIYFEPGKTTFQLIDLKTLHDPEKDGKTSSYFMGDNAKINSDLVGMSGIHNFNYQDMDSKILEMDRDEYKAYCFDIMDKDMAAFETYLKEHKVSKKAKFIKEKSIQFRAYSNVLSYNMNRESAYRSKNQVPRDQREIPLEKSLLDKDYLSFLQEADLNNSLNLAVSDYDILINRIKFTDIIRNSGFTNPYKNLVSEIDKKGISLTQEERNSLKLLESTNSHSEFNTAANNSKDILETFFSSNLSMLTEIVQKNLKAKYAQNLKGNLGIKPGLLADIMLSQDKHNILESAYNPYTPEQEKEVPTLFKNQFIANYLLEVFQGLKDKIAAIEEENKTAKGYHVNETPKTEADQLFDAMMAKFKGKVVYVDFWATWCGPCIAGMKKIAPLKDEMKGEDVVFVYITDQSSPEKTWGLRIPSIKGEHFRLTSDEWNVLSQKFQISGIPHYVLVNKEGKVIRNKLYMSNAELKALMKENLN
ncbi:TlpA family protein disulfide reductase [Echinicola shivajiensis]|uniref:TlpA family protein disulfide reductase n=1 Tax=Echinicola shivajiensis TaxID=1035916 RepID=UPI001BFC3429|nr:TlpA disulfide reductase family protein [Echinicola shivajiensis]